MKDALGNVGLVFYITLLVLLIFISPLISIAAINTLFDISIKYSLLNYLSMMWIHLAVGGSASS